MNSISRMPPARELHVVGTFGPAGRTALRFVAHLAVQLAQAFEHAVVEVTPVDEVRHHRTQRQRAAVAHTLARRDDTALEPGKTLPLAALHLQVLLEHRQAHDRRAGVAVGAQREVDAEHEAVVGGVADQRVQAAREQRKILVRRHALRPARLAAFFVDVDEVDVGRHVELARAELAHADDPEVDPRAGFVERLAVALVELAAGGGERDVERGFGELGHRERHVFHSRVLLDVEHGQAFEHQVARDTQRTRQRPAAELQLLDQRRDRVAPRQARRQQRELGRITPADALHEAAVIGASRAGSRARIDAQLRGESQAGNPWRRLGSVLD
jgi:hypothetical protein